MSNLSLIAAKIYVKLCTDTVFEDKFLSANEPYRMAITESGYANNITDGSAEYHKVVDILEVLVCG